MMVLHHDATQRYVAILDSGPACLESYESEIPTMNDAGSEQVLTGTNAQLVVRVWSLVMVAVARRLERAVWERRCGFFLGDVSGLQSKRRARDMWSGSQNSRGLVLLHSGASSIEWRRAGFLLTSRAS